jgi:hypothetical protein
MMTFTDDGRALADQVAALGSRAQTALDAATATAKAATADSAAKDVRIAELQAQVAQLQAQLPDDGRPTGEQYIRYEDLYVEGDTLQQTFNRLTEPKIVTMPAGVFETRRPWGKAPYAAGVAAPSTAYAFRPPKICRGIIGAGPGALGSTEGTVIRVTPNTCRSASEGGSWFQGGGSGSGDFILQGIHIEGTDQGMQTATDGRPGLDGKSPKLFTNCFLNGFPGVVAVQDVLTTGWYGNNGAPPGETFGLQVYNCDNHVLIRVEADGRRDPEGPSFGAVGLSAGTSFGARWIDCYSHHSNAKTYAMVFYQQFNSTTVNCRCGDAASGDGVGQFGYNGGGFNQERCAGIEHTRLDIYCNRKAGDKGVHFNHSSDAYSVTLRGRNFSAANGSTTLTDCTWNNMWGTSGNPLYVSTWVPYGGNPNAITTSPVVTLKGASVPFRWVFGGKHYTVTGPAAAPVA